ncbi:MAG: hypothetical protein ACRC4O_08465, partial [Giesbergeria sp.]
RPSPPPQNHAAADNAFQRPATVRARGAFHLIADAQRRKAVCARPPSSWQAVRCAACWRASTWRPADA